MNAPGLAACLAEVGGVLVRWTNIPGRDAWATPDGNVSMDATSVETIARAGLGRFVAWRVPAGTEALRGTHGRTFEALPVVFRLCNGVTLREWKISVRITSRRSLNPWRWVRPSTTLAFRGNVFAVDETEAKAFAILAGLVFVPPAYLLAEPIGLPNFAAPIRPSMTLGQARPATDAEKRRDDPPPDNGD